MTHLFATEAKYLRQVTAHEQWMRDESKRNGVMHDISYQRAAFCLVKCVKMVPPTVRTFDLFIDKLKRRLLAPTRHGCLMETYAIRSGSCMAWQQAKSVLTKASS